MDINILLIEDNLGDARLFLEMINDINSQFEEKIVFTHTTSLDDLKDICKQKHCDIVFLDLGLEKTSGVETLLAFKNIYDDIPVVAYTGVDDLKVGEELLKQGAYDYLCKNDATASILAKTIWINIKRLELDKKLKEKESMLIAQSRSAAMGEMIGMIAHQWKQPLAILSMIANNMIADFELESVKEEDFKTYALDITKQVQHLAQTIDDFSNFFKPKNEKTKCDIIDVMEDTIKLISKSLENNNIALIKNYQDIPVIDIYKNELSHVFLNIINNAKEALVEKNISDKKVTIDIKKDNENLYINISDNAGGVVKENINKLFEPYFTTKSKLNGTGLGLYISKTIIEEHFSGNIEIENKNGGASFTITLPLS